MLGAVWAAAVPAVSGADAAAVLTVERVTVCGCSLPNFSLEDAWRQALELGFSGIEIAVFADNENEKADRYPWVVVDRLTADEKVRLQALAGRFRHVTTHLPYGAAMRPLARDPVIREKSRRELHRALDDSGFWRAQVATVHVMSEPGLAYAAVRAELIDLYRELGAHAATLGVRLAIETTRPYAVAEYLDLVRAIDRENVGATVDTGHISFYRDDLAVAATERETPEAVRRYNDLLLRIVTELGPKLFHLHVDEVRRVDWREHFVPGQGIVDWARLFGQLSRMRYRGLLAAEILYYDGATDTGLLRTRVFTQRTREGAPAAGLRATREFFAEVMRALPAAPSPK